MGGGNEKGGERCTENRMICDGSRTKIKRNLCSREDGRMKTKRKLRTDEKL